MTFSTGVLSLIGFLYNMAVQMSRWLDLVEVFETSNIDNVLDLVNIGHHSYLRAFFNIFYDGIKPTILFLPFYGSFIMYLSCSIFILKKEAYI